MSVAATRWRQDATPEPTNPHQLLRWYPTYPSNGGGYSTFGWSPQPNPGFKLFSPSGTVAGLGAPLVPTVSGIAKVVGAVAGIATAFWLAKLNLGR